MPRYMAIIIDSIRDATSEESGAVYAEYVEFMQEARAAGVNEGLGEALQDPSTATTIHVEGGKGGQVQILDAPYAEAKEAVAGYFLLDCADLDEALGWAAKIPGAWHGRVEVRPVVDYSGSM
jgi:hypothetical protein